MQDHVAGNGSIVNFCRNERPGATPRRPPGGPVPRPSVTAIATRVTRPDSLTMSLKSMVPRVNTAEVSTARRMEMPLSRDRPRTATLICFCSVRWVGALPVHGSDSPRRRGLTNGPRLQNPTNAHRAWTTGNDVDAARIGSPSRGLSARDHVESRIYSFIGASMRAASLRLARLGGVPLTR